MRPPTPAAASRAVSSSARDAPPRREILTCRVIDRGLRPLFPNGYHRETQVIALVFSADDDFDPDVLGICGSSLALMAAGNIPFDTPIAGVRIGRIDGEFIVFPTYEERKTSELDLVVSGTEDAIAMVECGASELPESVILDALDLAHHEIKSIIAVQREIVAELGVVKEEFAADPDPWPESFRDRPRRPLDGRASRGPARSRQVRTEGRRRTRFASRRSTRSPRMKPTSGRPGSRRSSARWSRRSHARRSSTRSNASTAGHSTRSGP